MSATSLTPVSPRLDAQERLHRAEAASGIGTFELDLGSGEWDLGPHVATLFGFVPGPELAAFSDLEPAIFADDVPKLRAAIDAAKEKGIYQVEFRVRHPDGSVHWLAGRGILDADGSDGRLMWGAFIDITERKALEARLLAFTETLEARVAERARALAASTARLEETQWRFALLVDAVTDYAIFMLDRNGRIESWNAGAQRIKGYAREEILGRHLSTFYTEEDRGNGVPERALETARRTGKYEAEGWRVRKDGSRFWASVVLTAIRDPEQGLVGFAKITRDLTERRANEERMRQAQKMEALGQLTGGVAHDFNNILTVISGNIEALLGQLSEHDDRLRRLANAALRGTERAAMLVQQLLAFSRRQPLAPKPISVTALVSTLSELLRRAIGESVEIETVTGARLWPIFADANQLESALINLAVNARDAMPNGGRLTIEATNAELDQAYAGSVEVAPGNYVCIAVSDNGTGMTAEVASKAFDPFFTTKPLGQGTGLGLSQVYGFIKQSGGHVRIYSELGVGTTVRLYLPRHVATDGDAEEPIPHVPPPRARGETILVVEDDPDVRSATIEMLRELGYAVLAASDGGAGLRLLDGNRAIDLLLTDVGLPGAMNGRQLADEALCRRARLKVLFTSGYAQNVIVHHGRLDPGIELIAKPYTYAALAARVRRLLDAP